MDAVLQALDDVGEAALLALFLVFVRIGSAMFLIPGFGEIMIPARIRLIVALALTLLVWPMVQADVLVAEPTLARIVPLLLAEAVAGLLLGLALRFILFALQFAAAIAAQSMSLSQMFGAGATPDPMPAFGNILVISALTLAIISGLHVKIVFMVAGSYALFPLGGLPTAMLAGEWAVTQAARSFSLALSLSAPFAIMALVVNLAFGAINRAMPALMVSFIGAPLLTAGSLLLLILTAPVLLQVWLLALDSVLSDPFGPPR